MKESGVTISTYHEYILEAIASIRLGMTFHKERNKFEPAGSDNYGLMGDMYGRYAFLMIANSLEAAANALLLSLNVEKDYYEELEKLNTAFKFRMFCNSRGCKLDTGNVKIARIKDVIACRNEFVHPKPKRVEYTFEKSGKEIYHVGKTKQRHYPHYHSILSLKDAVQALEDTLAFLAWVTFDVCGFSIHEGALLLGCNSYGSTADIDFISSDTGIKFDLRSFGKVAYG